MSLAFFAAAVTAITAGMRGGMYPAPSCSGGRTPRKLALEGPLNDGKPCPVEAVRRGTRKTRRQRKKGGAK